MVQVKLTSSAEILTKGIIQTGVEAVQDAEECRR
jgi:hypothetical protein